MVNQTLVIMKKEWTEIAITLFSYHNYQAGIWPILLFCIAFGIYEPLRMGITWMQSPIIIFSFAVLLPLITIGFISPYSFVGERLRGTMEPLLATPVSDQAILFGKIGIAVLCGIGVTLINLTLGLGVINLFSTNGRLMVYPANMAISTLLFSLLFSILVATLGTNFSIYAKTLLEAQNNLGIALFIPLMLPALLVGPFIPETWKSNLSTIITQLGGMNPLIFIMRVLLIIDGICIFITLHRFHRKLLLTE